MKVYHYMTRTKMGKLSYILEEVILESRRKDVIEKHRKILDGGFGDTFGENPTHLDGKWVDSFDDVVTWVEKELSHPKYLDFVLGGLCCGGYGAEPDYMVDLVNDFHELSERNYIENKDIYSKEYQSSPSSNYTDFNRLEEVIENAKINLEKKETEKRVKKDKVVIYEDDRWRVIVPKTHEASCHYGAGTKWCTTSKDEVGHFINYTDIGILYYILDKTKTSDVDDVMYKIALFLRYRVTKDIQLGDVYAAIPFNRAAEMFDSQDREVNFEHVLPLLPAELENSVIAYYYKIIKENNNRFEHNTKKMFIDNNYLNIFIDKFNTKTLNDDFFSGMGTLDWDVKNTHGLVFFNFGDATYYLYFLPTSKNSENSYLYDLYVRKNLVNIRIDKEFLPERQISKKLKLGQDEKSIVNDMMDYSVYEVLTAIKRYYFNKKIESGDSKTYIEKDNTIYWKPLNSASSYKFKYPPKEGSLTYEFIKSVKENPGITPKEFYKDKYDFDYYSGYNTQFFGSIKDSGILRVEKGPYGILKYYLGPNYEAWTKGNIKRLHGRHKPIHLW